MALELHFKIHGVSYRWWDDPRLKAADAYLCARSLGIKVKRPF